MNQYYNLELSEEAKTVPDTRKLTIPRSIDSESTANIMNELMTTKKSMLSLASLNKEGKSCRFHYSRRESEEYT